MMDNSLNKRHILVYGLVFIVSIINSVDSAKDKDMKELCKMCKSMSEGFSKKVKQTAKSNFGGGNTRWEEKSLGSYAFSETRLLEITEALCPATMDEKKCHAVLESNEHLFEHYWFKIFKANPDEADLYDWLCLQYKKVDDLEDGSLYEPACCKSGSFGAECSPCSGGSENPCSGRGKCDGDATRGGTGKCLCDTGYQGSVCDTCAESYYQSKPEEAGEEKSAEEKNTGEEEKPEEASDRSLECKSCHISCKTCTGGEASQCDECRNGYNKNPANQTTVCEDIDECENKALCTSGKYCSNTVGSYVCMTCDPACDQCLGGGNDKCVKCNKGYQMEENKCIDIDECASGELCQEEHMYCQNTRGSYKCKCRGQYEVIGDKCLRKPPDPVTGQRSTKKRGAKSTDDMFKNVSPYNMSIFFATLGLFAATGHFLRGHIIGSLLLIAAMSLTLYRIAANFG